MNCRARSITASQAKFLDIKAKTKYGIPTLILMENAGRAVADTVWEALRHKKGRVALLCGKGNNGGDGFCAARHLLTRGVVPDVYLAGKVSEVAHEARVNLDILLRLGQKITQVNDGNLMLVKRNIAGCRVIVDALLGVGLQGEVKGLYPKVIELVNASGAIVVAVDLPSGLDATDGRILGCCVRADATVTFVAKKRGMILGQGPKFCGRIVVKDIGAPLQGL